MKPLFFPFTHLRDKDARALVSCFGRAAFLSTRSASEVRAGEKAAPGNSCIETLFMEEKELQPILERVAGYREWARIHSRSGGPLKSFVKKTPYFTSTTSVGAIRSQISRKAGQPESGQKREPEAGREELLAEALLFLRLAQEQDEANEAIDAELSAVMRSQGRVLASVRGDSLQDTPDSVQEGDPGNYMAEKRITSWARLFNEKRDLIAARGPMVLATTSPAVVETLEQMAEKSVNILDRKQIIMHEGSSSQGRAASGEEGEGDRAGQWYLFSETDIKNIFCLTEENVDYNKLIQGAGDGKFPVVLVGGK